jgi:hypothetical protein
LPAIGGVPVVKPEIEVCLNDLVDWFTAASRQIVGKPYSSGLRPESEAICRNQKSLIESR